MQSQERAINQHGSIIIFAPLPLHSSKSPQSADDGGTDKVAIEPTIQLMRIGATMSRTSCMGDRGTMGTLQHGACHEILSDLFLDLGESLHPFPDLGESTYENWDFKQGDVLMAFLNQRMLAAPDETRHIWKLDGPLETNPNDETPSMAWLHMAHVDPSDLGPPRSPALRRVSLVEFTDLLNGCSPDALVRNAFVLLYMVATARYLHLKSQGLHESLMEAHETIGFEVEEMRPSSRTNL